MAIRKEDPEIRAIKRVERALVGLNNDAKHRVLDFVSGRIPYPYFSGGCSGSFTEKLPEDPPPAARLAETAENEAP